MALGHLLADMHDAGIVHHDLHPGNVLLQLDEEDRPRLFLIDLQAVRLGPPLPWRASRDNVVILNGDARINGRVDGSVFALNGDVIVRGTVKHDVHAFNGRVIVEGGARVGGDVDIRRAG